MAANAITPELLQYAGENSKELLLLAYQAMDVWKDVTVLPDVKNKIRLTTLLIDKMVKPFKSAFQPTDNVIKFSPREIEVQVAKADLLVDPEAYRQTYLAEFMKPGVARTPEDLPFETFVWEQIFQKFGEELNNDTAYLGVHDPNGTDAADVADGFGTILAAMILAGDVVPETLGALTPTTATAKLKELYRTIPSKYRKPNFGLKAYMSLASYEAYEDEQETKGYNTGRGADMLKPKWLRGSEGILELKPVTWMGESDRIIMTPFSNIIVAADATEQDLAKMNVVPDVWTAKVGIAAALGFNFRFGGLIWCNETV